MGYNRGRLARYGIMLLLAFGLVGGGMLGPLACAAQEAPDQAGSPTLAVTLQDEDGAPVQGVTLQAISADFTGSERGRATTDQTGKAVFQNLRSGRYYFFANVNALDKHSGYGAPVVFKAFKTTRSFFLSEPRALDLNRNTDITFVIKRDAHIWLETYLQVVKTGKVVILNQKMGMQQIIPVASIDFMRIYLPMRNLYGVVTIKDGDYDAWVMEFYAHERMRIDLL